LVVQLIQDYEDYGEVNKQLEKMGYNIGTRLIEDFLARSGTGRCADFRDVGEVVAKVREEIAALSVIRSNIAQVGFKSFLNITPNVTHSAPPSAPLPGTRPAGTPAPPLSGAGSSFMLTLDENPLAEFVELPEDALEGGLWFSNVLCGVLRGSLEMVCLVNLHLTGL
jgi:trafficking protein particle complex subunit 3